MHHGSITTCFIIERTRYRLKCEIFDGVDYYSIPHMLSEDSEVTGLVSDVVAGDAHAIDYINPSWTGSLEKITVSHTFHVTYNLIRLVMMHCSVYDYSVR